jgi:adenylate kinase
MSMVIVLLGMPGSGKGTQSALISKKLGLPIVSIGDALREKAKKDDRLGQKIKIRMASGLLMSQDIIKEVIREQITLDLLTSGFVLDGYPRDIHQGRWFDRWSAQKALSIRSFHLLLSEDTAKRRLAQRLVCNNCHEVTSAYLSEYCGLCGGNLVIRDDDYMELISQRIEIYKEQTLPLIRYYLKSNRLIEINGGNCPEDVFENIERTLKSLNT